MSEVLQLRRTGWDIVVGALLIVASLVALGNVVLATAVSVLLIAWCALFSGIAMAVAGLIRIRSDFSWSVLLGGAGLAVLGLFMVRNPAVSAVALTLVAGALFFSTGMARIFIAVNLEKNRLLLVISGVISVGLGVWVLVNPGAATLKLLGTLLAVQVMLEGVTLIAQGRLRLTPLEANAPAATT